ncbi:MAG: hypothetical protein CVU38_18225 [Chloroflexi bacterium HGW-Chloroflexi-1]|nr:MAG: hypothetical protein CVU38_18225 [Chloroflexi bacterium HGW-Chloroflexi-1]
MRVHTKYRTLVDNIQDGVFIIQDAKMQFVNEAFARMVGYPVEEVIGMDFLELVAPEDHEMVADCYYHRQAGKDVPREYKFRMLHKDGKTRTIVNMNVGLVTYQDRVVSMGTVKDITARVRAEEEIKIENARLFQAEQVARERADTLREVSRAVSSTLKLDEVLSLVLRQAKRVLTYDTASILLCNDDQPSMVAVTGYEDEELVKAEVPLRLGASPILQAMARDHRPVVIADVREDERWIWVPGAEDIRAWIGAPLLVRDEMIGALMIDSTQPGFYTAADATITQALAHQAAIAIENARLYAEAQQRARQLEALIEVGRAIGSTLDLDEVLQLILERLEPVVPYDTVSLWLREGEVLRVQAVRGFERPGAHLGLTVTLQNDGLSQEMMSTRRPLILADAQRNERFRGLGGTEWVHSWLGVPLLSKGEVIGLVTIDKREPGLYTAEMAELVLAFGQQAAMAIENARLLEAERRRAEEIKTLAEVGRAVSSTLDLDQVLKAIATHATTLSHSDEGGIFELDQAEGVLRITASYNASQDFVRAVNEAGVRIGEGAIGRAAATRKPVQIVNTETEPGYRFPKIAAMDGICSILAVPMLRGEELLGGIVLWRRQPGLFTSRDVALLTALADNVAIALENARLYQAERRRRQEAETLRQAALVLTTTLDRNQVLEHILTQLQWVVPYDTTSVQLLRNDRLEIIGGAGFPNLAELVGITFDLTSGDNPNRQVISSRAPHILEDAPTVYKEFRREPHAQANIRSWLGVPMLVGDRIVGMIALDKHEPGFYTEEHARLAQAFAAQAAVAIENSRLYEEIMIANTELAAALRLREEMVQNVSHELRTPLALIRGYAELMLSDSMGHMTPEQERALQIMMRRSQELGGMVDDLLMLKTPEARSSKRETFDLSKLISETMEGLELKAKEAGITFKQDLSAETPPVKGNMEHIRRVVSNLLGNAIKFSPDGGVVTAKLRPYSKEEVLLSVSDTGIGIPPDKLDKIFDRFYQVDGSTTRRFGGAGIGLALVEEIVAGHGGRVWAESAGIPGKGATFFVTLPAAEK